MEQFTNEEIHEIIRAKRIKFGHPLEYTPKQRKNIRFKSDTLYLVGQWGVLSFRSN